MEHSSDSHPCGRFRIGLNPEDEKGFVGEAPLLMSFDQDAWAKSLDYENLDSEQHLLLFQLLRSSMLPILMQLPPEKWERVGIYADAGPFTLLQLLEYRVEHVRGHLAQIARVREAYQQSKI
jgi:hypothetical protein